jgi:spore germination protein GerM
MKYFLFFLVITVFVGVIFITLQDNRAPDVTPTPTSRLSLTDSQPKSQAGLGMTEVVIYFNNERRAGKNSNDCHLVYGVERSVPKTSQIAKRTLQELFAGPTELEKKQGYTSFFSEQTKDILISVEISERIAYVDFKDIRNIIPNASSSCGSAQFFAEIEETLKQFRTIDSVMYAINGDPEPFYEWMQIGCTQDNNYCDDTFFK